MFARRDGRVLGRLALTTARGNACDNRIVVNVVKKRHALPTLSKIALHEDDAVES